MGQELQKLGPEVRLMTILRITPYRAKQKNDRKDTAALGETGSHLQMGFVPSKTVGEQAV